MTLPHLNTETMEAEGIPMEALSGQEDSCPGGDFEQENRETVGTKEIPEQAPLVQEDLFHGGDPEQQDQGTMEAAECPEQAPLDQGNFCPDGDPEQGNKKGQPKHGNVIKVYTATGTVCFVAILLFCILLQEIAKKEEKLLSGPACPNEWIGYQGMCYYFSTEKRNWSLSQQFCSSQMASLLIFNPNQKMDVVMRYKGKAPFWFGLRRDPGQPWKWTNGEESTLEVIGDGGDCSFLNSEATATSSRCRTELFCICSKPDVFKAG